MSFLRKSLLEVANPLVQAKRFRGKINVQKPKPPHFEKAKYIALSKPYFINPKKGVPLVDLCQKNVSLKNEEEVNPYQEILAREVREFFESSRLVAFYHANPMNGYDQFKAFAMFKKEGMLFRNNIGKKTLEMAIKGTPYEAVLDIYMSRNVIVFSPEPNIKQLLKISKRYPQIILLAGIYDGKFMNVEDLTKFSTISNLETAQAMLVQTLNSSANRLHRQLNSHQTSLLALLEDRRKQLLDKKE